MERARECVLEKVGQVLERSVPVEEVYAWALGFAAADGYDGLHYQDPAADAAVRFLMHLNRTALVDRKALMTLEYFRQCLSGNQTYRPLDEHPPLAELSPAVACLWAEALHTSGSPRGKILQAAGIYVRVFAAWVVVFHLWMLIRLGGPWSYHRASALWTFPFLFYGAGLLVIPVNVMAADRMFWGVLTGLTAGAGYFMIALVRPEAAWWTPLWIRAFLGIIPAVLALGLVLEARLCRGARA